MNATLLILLIAQQGYWIGDQDQTISIGWATTNPAPPAAELQWELGLNNVKLNSGTVRLEPGGLQAGVTVKVPQVRVRTAVRWTYRLIQIDNKKVLETGERTITIFPSDLTSDLARRVGGRKLLVLDEAGGTLTKSLEAAKVPFTRVDDLAKLFEAPELLLIAADRLGPSGLDQAPLLNLARAGTSVAVFRQSKPEILAGYPIHQREAAGQLQFRGEHPLFERFEPDDLRGWLAVAGKQQLAALQLPANEPALELAWWSRETPGDKPAPLEAMIVSKSTGQGRIVLCQLPVGAWESDPRSQIFLGNLLSYMSTRPEPTLPPSERREPAPVLPQTRQTIDFSPGARP